MPFVSRTPDFSSLTKEEWMGAWGLAATPLDGWSILFAREPEPDLELDEMLDDVEDRPSPGAPHRRPRRPSSRKPIHWVMFLLIVGAGAVFAYDPEFVMELFGQGIQPSAPPVITAVPKARRAPAAPSQPTPMPNVISTTPALPSQPTPVAATSAPVAALSASPIPLYSEGQRVIVLADPALPSETVHLSADSAGTGSGPGVRAGTTLTVLDGELRDTGWVYSVRSAEGLTGWVAEKRLALLR
jgi:hypothetical protein